MLLLPFRAMLGRRSNRHLHHRLAAAFATAFEGCAGERLRSACWDGAQPLCPVPAFHRAKYPTSSPPASVEPRTSRQTGLQNYCRGALDAPQFANPHRVRSAIGVRLIASFPPAGPARLGTRFSSASPGIRVSRSGKLPGNSVVPRAKATKNPPERRAREGP
jgi:hypothetical protein